MKELIIIRGPSGSGKTTIAKKIKPVRHFEADDFFTEFNLYKFDATKLPVAHRWCRDQVQRAMFHDTGTIVVSNTSTTKREVEPYLELAKEYGYEVKIYRTQTPWDPNLLHSRNLHNVPIDTIKRQIKRYEPYQDEVEWT